MTGTRSSRREVDSSLRDRERIGVGDSIVPPRIVCVQNESCHHESPTVLGG